MNDVLALTAAAAFASLVGVVVSMGRLVRRVRAERHLVEKIAEQPELKNCPNPKCNMALSNTARVCGNCGRLLIVGEPRDEQLELKICPTCKIALSNNAWVCGNCGTRQTVGEPREVGRTVNVADGIVNGAMLGWFNLEIPKYKDQVTKVLTRELIPSEQKEILAALEQPSLRGQQQYILKLLKQVGKHRTPLL